jgi:hypothetical protein
MSLLDDICLTASKEYLALFVDGELFFIGIDVRRVVSRSEISSSKILNQDCIDYYITPTNVASKKLYNLSNILNNDECKIDNDEYENNNCIIGLNSLFQLIIVNKGSLEQISIITGSTNFKSFKTFGSILLAFSEQLNKLFFYNLSQILNEKKFE